MKQKYSQFFQIFCLFLQISYIASQAGGWKDYNDKQLDQEKDQIQKLVDLGLNKTEGANYKFLEVLSFQKQVVAGTNYKITILANHKQVESDRAIIFFKLFEPLKQDNNDELNIEIVQHLTFTPKDEFKYITANNERSELYHQSMQYLRPKDSKLAAENFIYQRKFTKGLVYIVNMDIEKTSKNRIDRFETWFLFTSPGVFEPLFHKKIAKKDGFKREKLLDGSCQSIGSYFFCAMRHECTTEMFEQEYRCANKYKDDL